MLTSKPTIDRNAQRSSNIESLRSRTSRLEQGLGDHSRDEFIEMPPLTHSYSEEPEELEPRGGLQESTVPILTNTRSESSGVDPPSRSGTFPPNSNLNAAVQSRSGPQVRNTHRQE